MEILLVIVGALFLLCTTYTNAAATIDCSKTITATSPTNDDRDKMLAVFNELRKKIVAGKDKNLKSAKNMYKLFWDCNMEKKLTDAIDPAKGKMTLNKKYAQNYDIFLITAAATADADGYTKVAEANWYKQVIMVGLDKNQTYTDNLDFFANMVNAKATQVACAYKDDGTNVHYSCIFNVKPVKGQSIYQRGKPCTTNKQCTTYPGSFCDTATNLCEYKGDIPDTETTPTGTPSAAAGNAMTAESRTKVINAHNYRRTLLTTGQIRNGKNPDNANLPKAAYMSKMDYDMSLETQAMAYAQQCKMIKSEESTRTGYGENTYLHPTVMKDPVELMLQAIVNWWTQIFQDGINWQVIYKQSLADKFRVKGIDQTAFTQMAWAKTNKVGCAIVECSGKSFVVCRYSPAGNILDQPIYETGNVCGSCPGTCNPADGLCVVP